MSIHSTQLPGVYTFHDELPKHTESPTDNVRAFKSDLPFPTVRSGSSAGASASNFSFREDEEAISNDGIADQSILDVVPTELIEHDGHRTRLRMIQCRLYLLRCEVLQSRANAVEPKPWAQCPDLSALNHYDDILKCARYAQRLAEATSNHDLQARSKYWYGRGCGGLGDWEAAISHFAAAVKLHVPNGKPKHRTHQQRSVLQFNKDDAEFLLQSVTRHYGECTQKKREVCKAVHKREASPSPTKEVGSEVPIKSPWMPCYESMIHQAKEMPATEQRSTLNQLLSGKSASILNKEVILSKEEIVTLKKRLRRNDGKREIRTIFNVEEWLYILRGDEVTKERSDYIKRNSVDSQDILSDNGKGHHSEPSRAPSPVSSITTPPHSSPRIAHNLGTEMDRASYESGGATPSLFGSTRSPSLDEYSETPSPPTAGLQSRRDVRLPPISTSAIYKGARLCEAVQIPFTPTDSEMEKHVNEAELKGAESENDAQAVGS